MEEMPLPPTSLSRELEESLMIPACSMRLAPMTLAKRDAEEETTAAQLSTLVELAIPSLHTEESALGYPHTPTLPSQNMDPLMALIASLRKSTPEDLSLAESTQSLWLIIGEESLMTLLHPAKLTILSPLLDGEKMNPERATGLSEIAGENTGEREDTLELQEEATFLELRASALGQLPPLGLRMTTSLVLKMDLTVSHPTTNMSILPSRPLGIWLKLFIRNSKLI
jgi:hypothetical protein